MTSIWDKAIARKVLRDERKANKAKLTKAIEESVVEVDKDGEDRLIKTKRSNRLRIIFGLPLVQGSSIIALYDKPMIWYWTLLWFGLLVYFGTSIRLCKEAWDTHRDTKEKYESGRGSSDLNVRFTKEKRWSEVAYIIGNLAGLIFVGSNIYWHYFA